MKKKICIMIGVILAVIIIAGIITNYADSARVTTGHEPKYCIKVVSNDGSKVTYWGLGYKVIRYVGVSPNEPYENNIGTKIGNWFMKYELPKADIIEIEYEGQTVTVTDIKDIGIIKNILVNSKYNTELCKGINTHKITLNNEIYSIKEDCKEIQKGDKQAKITDEDLETINNIISNRMNNEQNSYSKKIDETTIEFNIPNEWNYEEMAQDENIFNAKIKKINEHNGITTILIKGFESNDINYRGEFEFSIDDDTKLLCIEPNCIKSSYTEIDLPKLKEGQNVSITSIGEVLESYPIQLTKVTKVVVLEEQL